MDNPRFSFKKRLQSFTWAWNGLRLLFREEHNARIHGIAACLAILAGIVFKISRIEWCLILSVIALVFAMELINSSIERLCDVVSPEKRDSIKKVKDMAAAAVLVSAAIALIVGVVIFLPKFI